MKHIALLAYLGVSIAAAPAIADPLVGIWKTEPDRKNLTSLIKVAPCGQKFCGTIWRSYDPSGKQVTTQHTGKPLFWDMAAKGGGAYEGGTFYIPLLDVTVKGKMSLSGNSVKVRGCKGPVCDGQTWQRVK